MCRTCVLYELINGLLWDRAVFSSVIELRVTHSKGLGFFKSQEINEMKYLSRPLKSMEDWIYGSLPWPKFTNAAKQLSVSSGKWLTTLSPIRAFDFVSNARLWKNKKIGARRSPKGSVFFTKKNPVSFLFVMFQGFSVENRHLTSWDAPRWTYAIMLINKLNDEDDNRTYHLTIHFNP